MGKYERLQEMLTSVSSQLHALTEEVACIKKDQASLRKETLGVREGQRRIEAALGVAVDQEPRGVRLGAALNA